MKKEHVTYIKIGIVGALFISVLIFVLKFIVFLNSTFHSLKENSPTLAYCVIGALILLFAIALCVGIALFYRQRQKTAAVKKKPRKEYTIKSQKEMLSDVEEALSDPQRTFKPEQNIPVSTFHDDRIKLLIYGHKNVGKTSLASALNNSKIHQGDNPLKISIEELALSPEINRNDLPQDIVYDNTQLFLFISDRDLRDYEFTKFKNIIKKTSSFLFVLSKVDSLSLTDKDEIQESIHQKLNRTIHSKNFISVSAAPLPKHIIKIDTSGNETEEVRKQTPDISQLLEWLISFANKYNYDCIKFT